MSEAVIRVRDLEKLYRVWTRARPTNLKERLHLAGAGLRARAGAGDVGTYRQDVWALRGISFDVQPGEVFGVIGPNGAGKSTLLTILARITEPTAGFAEIHGRTSSLLEVGTGFHPELTGRDNVYLNGAILGMSRTETARKFDEIVDFSGVADFIDIPVKRYSSGMQVRLAFAVAAQLDPEVLLLDEVLAVGDAEFQARCHARVEQITKGGRTVLFVSHDLSSIARLCRRAIVLEGGRIAFEGTAEEAVESYLAAHRDAMLGDASAIPREGSGELRVRRIEVVDARDGGSPRWGQPVRVSVILDLAGRIQLNEYNIELAINHPTGGTYIFLSTRFGANRLPRRAVDGPVELVCEVEDLPLAPAGYVVAATIEHHGEVVDRLPGGAEFTLLAGRPMSGRPIPSNYPAPVFVQHEWALADASSGADRIQTHAAGLPSAPV
jgi:homopolymeric O-antigen transport system ATP-binding protein